MDCVPEPLEFTLKLGRSHVEHRLISLQRYRIHFPLGDKPFEVTEGERTFVTYVDNANRIRLTEFLKGHPEAQVGDYLVFRRDPVTGTWDIQLRQGARQAQLTPTPAQRVPRVKRTAALTHQDIQATIAKLAPYYGMEAMQEYRGDIGTYDVIWKRVAAGHPAKVFEIQHRGNLDSAFVKLKHAYDLWNARLFLVTTSVADSRKAYQLLASSFHEMRPYLTIVPGWDLSDFAQAKERFGDLDGALK
jgi:hypothetical protein